MPGEADLELVEKIWSPWKKAVVAGSSAVEEQPDQRGDVLAENRGDSGSVGRATAAVENPAWRKLSEKPQADLSVEKIARSSS